MSRTRKNKSYSSTLANIINSFKVNLENLVIFQQDELPEIIKDAERLKEIEPLLKDITRVSAVLAPVEKPPAENPPAENPPAEIPPTRRSKKSKNKVAEAPEPDDTIH